MTATIQAIHDFYVASTAVVVGDVVCGAGANIWFGTIIRGDLARITLGKLVNLQDGCILHTDHGAPQVIEDGVVVGHRATLHGSRVGRDSLIGMGATLLSGVDIGEECLVAAGALVAEGKRVPPRSLVVGMPGKIVRTLTDAEVERTRAICRHYFEKAQAYARGEFRAPWER